MSDEITLDIPGMEEKSVLIEPKWKIAWESSTSKIIAEHGVLNISVINPEVITTSMVSKHVVYNVTTEPMGFSVRRRYNDFAWLRDVLTAKYRGLYIPALPGTSISSMFNSTDVNGDFVQFRMTQLNLFMQQLSKIHFLRTDPSLHGFLSIQQDVDFKAFLENSSSKTNTANNAGLDAWNHILEHLSSGVTNDSPLNVPEAIREMDQLKIILTKLESQCMIIGRASLKFISQIDAMNGYLKNWQQLESELTSNNVREDLKASIAALVCGGDVWFKSAESMPKMIASVFIANIKFQLVQIEGFREFLLFRENAMKDVVKVELEVAKALELKAKATQGSGGTNLYSNFMTFSTTKVDPEEQYLKKVTTLENLQSDVAKMSKALKFIEIDRFHTERIENIRVMAGTFCCLNTQISSQAFNGWLETAVASNINIREFENVQNLPPKSEYQLFADS